MNSRRIHWLTAAHVLQKRLKTARAASKGHGRWGRSSAWGTSQNHPVIRRRKGYPNTTPGSWWIGVAQSPTTKIFAGNNSLLRRNHWGRRNDMVWPLTQVTPVCPLTRLHLLLKDFCSLDFWSRDFCSRTFVLRPKSPHGNKSLGTKVLLGSKGQEQKARNRTSGEQKSFSHIFRYVNPIPAPNIPWLRHWTRGSKITKYRLSKRKFWSLVSENLVFQLLLFPYNPHTYLVSLDPQYNW